LTLIVTPAADLPQEYFITGYVKCSCQQTAGYRKQTAANIEVTGDLFGAT